MAATDKPSAALAGSCQAAPPTTSSAFIRLLGNARWLLCRLLQHAGVLLLLTGTAQQVYGQIALQYAMINACGDEDNHEFISFLATADLNPALINIRYGSDPSCATTTLNVYNSFTAQPNNQATIDAINALAGCTAFSAAANPIPAGSVVYVFDVDFNPSTYSGWSSFCANPGLVLFANFPNEGGNFLNGVGTRYFCVSYNGGPNAIYGYTNAASTNGGAHAIWTAPGTVSINNPASEDCNIGSDCTPPTFINPPTSQTVCGSYTLPPINGSNFVGTPAYYSGPNGTGTSFPPGSQVGSGTYYLFDPGSTCNPTVSFVITVNTPPTANPPTTPILICYTFIPPFVNVPEVTALFNQIQSEITGGVPGATVNWWFNAAANNPISFFSLGDLILLATGPQPATIYATVTLNGCTSAVIPVTSTVSPRPTANAAGPLQACDNGSGQGTFNLTTLNAAIGNNVTWYTDPQGTNEITNPSAYVSGNGQVYATTTNALGCESAPRNIGLGIVAPPNAGEDNTTTVCNNGGQANLPQLLLGSPTPGGSWSNVNNAPVSLANPAAVSFQNVPVGTYNFTYTVQGQADCPPDMATITVVVEESPEAQPVPASELELCASPTGGAIFDLTQFNDIVNGGSGLPVNWYLNQSLTQLITNPASFFSSGGTIYVVVGEAPCASAPLALTLTVLPAGTANPAGPLVSCDADGDGQAVFNLSSLTNTITGGQGVISWYTNESLNTEIFTPESYTAGVAVVYAVVVFNGCPSAPLAVDLSLVPGPNIDDIEDVSACGSYTLPAISGSNLSDAAYYTQPNGEGSTFEAGQEITTTTTLYAYAGEGDCSDEESFTVTIQPVPTAQPASLTACPLPGGGANFDLTAADNTVNGGNGFTVSWFSDAAAQNAIADPAAYNVAGATTVYATIESPGGCSSPPVAVSLSLLSGPQPLGLTASETLICGSSEITLFISLPDDGNSYGISLDNGSETLIYSGLTNLSELVFTVTETTTFTITEVVNEALACTFIPSPLPAVTITSVETPTANPASLTACDQGNGQATFDLNEAVPTIQGGLNTAIVVFYQDANANSPILNPDSYTSGNAVIYANLSSGDCFSELTEVTLEVSQPPVVSVVATASPSCAGEEDGVLNVVVDGVGGYTFDWSNDLLDGLQAAPGVGSGNYSVTVTDANGCSSTGSIFLDGPTPVSLSCSQFNPVSAPGAADGVAAITVSGGSEPYLLVYSGPTNGSQTVNSPGTSSLPALNPGGYTLELSDANGCVSTCNFIIASPNCQLQLDMQGSISNCFGATDGQITTSVAGATGMLTYNWNVDSLDGLDTLNSLLAGTYILSVIDEAGCSATDTIVLTTPPSMTLSMTVLQPASGPGQYDGSAVIAFGNGLAPYTLFIIPAVGDTVSYTILSDTAGLDTLRNLPADYYFVLLSDANDCSLAGGFVLCGNLVTSVTTTDVSCNGQADGTAIVQVSGAYPPLRYQWSNQVQNDSLLNLAAGLYYVTVTDSLGCQRLDSALILQPLPLELNCSVLSPASGSTSQDGSAQLIVAGGQAPYLLQYILGNDTTDIDLPAADTVQLNNLQGGDIRFVLTDANNCLDSCSLTIPVSGCSLTASFDSSPPRCQGSTNGTIGVLINGGSPPFFYDWSNNAYDGLNQLSMLAEGSYSVTITDGNGCTAALSTQLTAPPLLVINCSLLQPATGPFISNGRIQVSIAGGTAPYQINLLGTGSQTQQVAQPGNASLNDLLPGDYIVKVTDANGCESSCELSIPVSSCTLPTILNITYETCAGAADGSIVSIPGGQAPYIYNWSNGGQDSIISNLSPAAYSVTITDAFGCVFISSVTIEAGAPLPGVTVEASQPRICPNECARIPLRFTGQPPFQLFYSIVSGTDTINRLFSSSQLVDTLTICAGPLAAGSYLLDFNFLSDQRCINNNLNQQDSLTVLPNLQRNISQQLCPGESLQVGSEIFNQNRPAGSVLLPGQGSCDTLVSVALSFFPPVVVNYTESLCDGQTVTIGGEVFGSARPVGTVILRSSNGCDSVINVNLSILPLAVGLAAPRLCPGGSLTVGGQTFTAANPTGSVLLQGASSRGCDSLVQVNLSFFAPATSSLSPVLCPGSTLTVGGQTFSAANPQGTVTLTAAAANGCDSIVQVSLSFRQPAVGNLSRLLCPGEQLSLGGQIFSASNPAGIVILPGASQFGCDSIVNVSLSFRQPATSSLNTTLCQGGQIVVGGQTFNAANPQGTVVLLAAASSGCDSTVFVSLSFYPALTASLSGGGNICPGQPASLTLNLGGALVFDVTLGDGINLPFIVSGAVDGQTISVTPTVNTTYSLVAATASGISCPVQLSGSATVNISRVTATATASSNYDGFNLSCADSSDGAAVAAAANGFPPYTFNWSNGSTTTTASNLSGGQAYSVVVTDAAGCRDTALLQLLAPPAITFTAAGITTGCQGNNAGKLEISSVSGGSPPYEFSIDGVFFQQLTALPVTLPDLSAGAYSLIIQDDNDCSVTQPVAISAPSELIVDLGPDETIQLGDSIKLEALLNFTPANWRWTPLATVSRPDSLITHVSPLETTLYQLTATDANGCIATDWVRITVDETVEVYVPSAFSPNQDGVNDRIFIFSGPGVRIVHRFQIYNRWGDRLYEAADFAPNDPTYGWDGNFRGEPMNAGVYVYYAEIETITGQRLLLKGDLTLMR